jgi:anaerobic ribonucleoside-triphosphate reductase activating protein
MNYTQINLADVANGSGVRVSLFVSGCTIHCKGCFNPAAWDFGCGTLYTSETEATILAALSKPYIRGLSILGGEPLDQDPSDLVSLVKKAKQLYPEKDIWIWTGREFNAIRNHPLTKFIDVAVCGEFKIDERDITVKNQFRGSRNQRVVDVQKSLTENSVIPVSGIPNNEI